MKNQSNKSLMLKAALIMVMGIAVGFQVNAAPPGNTPKGNPAGHKSHSDKLGQHPVFRRIFPDFSGYSQPFSALGEPKNVIVLVRENGDLTKSYFVRSRYQNNTEQISVNDVLTTPPLISRFDFVDVDANGEVTSVSLYAEIPVTEEYLEFTAEEAILNLENFERKIIDDTWSESWNCNGGRAVSTCNWIGSVSGDPVSNNFWVSVLSPLGAGTINGIAFDDLLGDSNTYTSDIRHRVQAKGIGEVLRQDSGRPRVVVFYRINGATGGSLEGTPFASGGQLDGVLF